MAYGFNDDKSKAQVNAIKTQSVVIEPNENPTYETVLGALHNIVKDIFPKIIYLEIEEYTISQQKVTSRSRFYPYGQNEWNENECRFARTTSEHYKATNDANIRNHYMLTYPAGSVPSGRYVYGWQEVHLGSTITYHNYDYLASDTNVFYHSSNKRTTIKVVYYE